MATKSRTVFCSGIENTLPSPRLNQNALDEPPSRLSARWILKLGANCVVRIFERSANEMSEQNPRATRSAFSAAANVRRACRVASRPATRLPRSRIFENHVSMLELAGSRRFDLGGNSLPLPARRRCERQTKQRRANLHFSPAKRKKPPKRGARLPTERT